MARPIRLTPQKAAELKRKGWSHQKIADEYDITVSWVQQILRMPGGEIRGQLSHKRAIPWTVKKQHQQSTEARYLRHLSKLSQGAPLYPDEDRHKWTARSVISWARGLVDEGKDIDYSENRGFYFRDADPDNWHLKKLAQRAMNGQIRKL